MNDMQHDALRELDCAKAHEKLKRHEHNAAVRRVNKAMRDLRIAVRQDPESWYGTPRLREDTKLPIDLRMRA